MVEVIVEDGFWFYRTELMPLTIGELLEGHLISKRLDRRLPIGHRVRGDVE